MAERLDGPSHLSDQEILSQLKPGFLLDNLPDLSYVDFFIFKVGDVLAEPYQGRESENIKGVNRTLIKSTITGEMKVKGFFGQYKSPRILIVPPRAMYGMKEGVEPESIITLQVFANLSSSGRGIREVVSKEFSVYLRREMRKNLMMMGAFRYSGLQKKDTPDKLEKRLMEEAVGRGYDQEMLDALQRAVRLGLSVQ